MRNGTYNDYGDLLVLNDDVEKTKTATTNMSYDRYGNIKEVAGPENNDNQRYRAWYNYDNILHSHRAKTEDIFHFSSSAQNEYFFGSHRHNRHKRQQHTVVLR